MSAGPASLRPSRFWLVRKWPLLTLPPAIVFFLGILSSVLVGWLGLLSLADAAESQAQHRADLLADMVAARVPHLGGEDRGELVHMAARRTGAEAIYFGPDGTVLADATLRPVGTEVSTLVRSSREGYAATGLGRTRFAGRVVSGPAAETLGRVVVFVRVPPRAPGTSLLIAALAALTTLLVGVASVVAYGVASDSERDLRFVTERVRDMSHVPGQPAGEPIPVRSLDEVGQLTVSFNGLVERFLKAEAEAISDREQAWQADRDRAGFLAAVSHELRTPLHAILGFSEVLLQEVDGPLSDEAREEVEQIRASGQHLLAVVNAIVDLGAMESGQLRMHFADTDLSDLAQKVVREASATTQGRRLHVEVRSTGTVRAWVDPVRMRQILTNLISNAIKFTPSGEVVVSVEDGPPGFVTLSVKDTGVGIRPAERARLFGAFQQSRSEQRRRRGTGLGLAIAERLVALHGGTIELASEVGKGTEVRLRLPIRHPEGAAERGRA